MIFSLAISRTAARAARTSVFQQPVATKAWVAGSNSPNLDRHSHHYRWASTTASTLEGLKGNHFMSIDLLRCVVLVGYRTFYVTPVL
jgi:hypothetical protein